MVEDNVDLHCLFLRIVYWMLYEGGNLHEGNEITY